MSPAPTLRLFPRDYERQSFPMLVADTSTTLARAWTLWHPCEPHRAHDDDRLHRLSERVRDLAWLELEKLWDELEQLGLRTGEIVDCTVFPFRVGTEVRDD